jgi:hypothetical protein
MELIMAITFFSPQVHDVSDQAHRAGCKDCQKLREEIEARGSHFDGTQLKEIAALWQKAGMPNRNDTEGLQILHKDKSTTIITHNSITPSKVQGWDWYMAAGEHIKKLWDGALVMGGGANSHIPPNRGHRIKTYAMVDVYDLKLNDRDSKAYPLTEEDKESIQEAVKELQSYRSEAPKQSSKSSPKHSAKSKMTAVQNRITLSPRSGRKGVRQSARHTLGS